MRHETDVPWILDKACGRTRGEIPSSVNAKVGAGEDENRIHVAKHVKGEIDARSDLKGTEAVAGAAVCRPDTIESSADLEEEKCNQERLQYSSLDRLDRRRIRDMFAGVLTLAMLGYILNRLFLLIENHALAWHYGYTQQRS